MSATIGEVKCSEGSLDPNNQVILEGHSYKSLSTEKQGGQPKRAGIKI